MIEGERNKFQHLIKQAHAGKEFNIKQLIDPWKFRTTQVLS